MLSVLVAHLCLQRRAQLQAKKVPPCASVARRVPSHANTKTIHLCIPTPLANTRSLFQASYSVNKQVNHRCQDEEMETLVLLADFYLKVIIDLFMLFVYNRLIRQIAYVLQQIGVCNEQA